MDGYLLIVMEAPTSTPTSFVAVLHSVAHEAQQDESSEETITRELLILLVLMMFVFISMMYMISSNRRRPFGCKELPPLIFVQREDDNIVKEVPLDPLKKSSFDPRIDKLDDIEAHFFVQTLARKLKKLAIKDPDAYRRQLNVIRHHEGIQRILEKVTGRRSRRIRKPIIIPQQQVVKKKLQQGDEEKGLLAQHSTSSDLSLHPDEDIHTIMKRMKIGEIDLERQSSNYGPIQADDFDLLGSTSTEMMESSSEMNPDDIGGVGTSGVYCASFELSRSNSDICTIAVPRLPPMRSSDLDDFDGAMDDFEYDQVFRLV